MRSSFSKIRRNSRYKTLTTSLQSSQRSISRSKYSLRPTLDPNNVKKPTKSKVKWQRKQRHRAHTYLMILLPNKCLFSFELDVSTLRSQQGKLRSSTHSSLRPFSSKTNRKSPSFSHLSTLKPRKSQLPSTLCFLRSFPSFFCTLSFSPKSPLNSISKTQENQ